MPETRRPAVSNTTPLIALAGVGRLDLLGDLYGEVWIPDAVRREYDAGRRAGEPDLQTLSWLAVKDAEVVPGLPTTLGAGERATLSMAIQHNARIVLLDERVARRAAAERSLPVVGTLAVLVRAKQQGLLPVVGPVLDEMQSQGRRISARLRERVLAAAGE